MCCLAPHFSRPVDAGTWPGTVTCLLNLCRESGHLSSNRSSLSRSEPSGMPGSRFLPFLRTQLAKTFSVFIRAQPPSVFCVSHTNQNDFDISLTFWRLDHQGEKIGILNMLLPTTHTFGNSVIHPSTHPNSWPS